jgi:hypothetical protein
MFSLPSFPKLSLLIFVLALVWFGFRWIGRQQSARKAEGGGKQSRSRVRQPADAVDMVQCEVCDAFVPGTKASPCERAGCPY